MSHKSQGTNEEKVVFQEGVLQSHITFQDKRDGVAIDGVTGSQAESRQTRHDTKWAANHLVPSCRLLQSPVLMVEENTPS